MKWTPDGPYAIRCGSFVISKNDTNQGWIYMAYNGKEFVGRFVSADEAKHACSLADRETPPVATHPWRAHQPGQMQGHKPKPAKAPGRMR